MRRKFNTSYSYIDLLLNILQAFYLLLLLTVTVVNPVAKKNQNDGNVVLKAEYLITVEWPKGNPCDIDTFVQTPDKKIVWYGQKDVPTASIDRDDQGSVNNSVRLDDGTVTTIDDHWEHVTIRKAIKGEYIVNVLMFSKRDKGPVQVSVKVEKLNPYKLVWSGKVPLEKQSEERTAIRFKMDSNGNATNLSNMHESVAIKVRQAFRGFRP